MSLADLFADDNDKGADVVMNTSVVKKPNTGGKTSASVKSTREVKKVSVISASDAVSRIDKPVAPVPKKRRVTAKSKTTVSTNQQSVGATIPTNNKQIEKSLPSSNSMSASQIAALTPADQALLRMQQMQRRNYPKQLQTLQVWVNAVQKMQLDLGVSVMAGAAVDLCTSGKY